MTPIDTALQVLPAVDVAGGRAVQLVQGVPGSGGEYGDVLQAALRWQSEGARWVHVVDLDAAFGCGSAHDLLARVVGELDVDVQLSGGIRDEDSLRRALRTGCRRVVLGTAALEDPVWTASVIDRYGDRVAVGLDVREGTLRSRGWTREGGELPEVLERLDAAGCERYVVTDVSRDGMLSGPNVEPASRVFAWTGRPVIVSGGVTCEQDVTALRGTPGVEGVIVGSALYRGRVTMAGLLRAAGVASGGES